MSPYAMNYCFHRGYSGQIISTEAHPNFRYGRFAIDGDDSYSENLTTTVPPKGTHLYATVTTNDCAANRLSSDRGSTTRVGGRALSELVIFDRVLSDAEYASVENYLNAKWFLKTVSVSESVSVTSPISYPYLTLEDGASFAISPSALSKDDAAITVYGMLEKDFSGKIRVTLSGDLTGGTRTLVRCADAGELTLDDFDLVGFPEGAEFSWDGRDLKVAYKTGLSFIVK